MRYRLRLMKKGRNPLSGLFPKSMVLTYPDLAGIGQKIRINDIMLSYIIYFSSYIIAGILKTHNPVNHQFFLKPTIKSLIDEKNNPSDMFISLFSLSLH